ncbi:hypothetical protein GALL_111990 [mine drainage metagenome]|uniref:Uncharacterized protein n=1 Tax=mine drainage metagenome TaxID=410659 RepID=A0A1J5SDP7_9ZZZZ
MPVFAKQYNAYFIFVYIERNAGYAAWKLKKLFKAYTRQARYLGNACGDTDDCAYLSRRKLWRKRFPRLAYS